MNSFLYVFSSDVTDIKTERDKILFVYGNLSEGSSGDKQRTSRESRALAVRLYAILYAAFIYAAFTVYAAFT